MRLDFLPFTLISHGWGSIFSCHHLKSKSKSKYITNYECDLTWNGEQTHVVMTSVLGHLYESDFGTEHKKWKLPDIEKLFSAEVYSTVAEVWPFGGLPREQPRAHSFFNRK